jgi:hypothetical protein
MRGMTLGEPVLNPSILFQAGAPPGSCLSFCPGNGSGAIALGSVPNPANFKNLGGRPDDISAIIFSPKNLRLT